MGTVRDRLTYANVMATIAVFVALGGTSIAAISLTKNSVKGKHIARNAVTSPKVKDRSLRAQDFASGQLPAGERGLQGAQGGQGIQDERGLQGERGEQGVTGNTGATGPSMGRSSSGFGTCDPVINMGYVQCVGHTMILPAAGRVLVVAAADWNDAADTGSAAAGSCRVWLDGATQIGPETYPGQMTVTHSVVGGSPGILYDGSTALTAVSEPLSVGSHTFQLQCRELDANIVLPDASLSTVLLGPS